MKLVMNCKVISIFLMLGTSTTTAKIMNIIYDRKYEEEHRIMKNSHYNVIIQMMGR